MIRSLLAGPAAGTGSDRTWGGIRTATTWGAAVGMISAACLALTAGLVDLTAGGGDTPVLLMAGGLAGVASSLLVARVNRPDRIRPSEVLSGATTALVSMVLCVAGLYLLTGAAGQPDDALFEATSGVTTTALSVLDPNSFGRGLLLVRAGSQWFGGLGALVLAVVILPFQGSGGEFADRSGRDGRIPLAPNQRVALRNIFALYVPLSLVIWLAYNLAGSGWFDSLLLAMATVSTGGFTGPGNLLVDGETRWVAVVGMILSGTSIVVLWRLVVGRGRGLLRSRELRSYLSILIVATGLFLAWSGPMEGVDLREALFTVSSAITTTGFPSDPMGEWSAALPVLLLLLVAIGPMTGSAGGGFQILRLRILLNSATREMVRQLHPRVVARVRLGGRVAEESTVRQATVVQFVFVAVLFTTALVVATLGLDIAAALSASVHAVSTAGPVRALDGSILDPSGWPRPTRLALLPAMVSGRLFLYPAAVTGGTLLIELGNQLRLRRRWRRWRARGTR